MNQALLIEFSVFSPKKEAGNNKGEEYKDEARGIRFHYTRVVLACPLKNCQLDLQTAQNSKARVKPALYFCT